MLEEVRWASHFLARTYCPPGSPSLFRGAFSQALEGALLARYTDHWYPHYPILGSAYRCVMDRDAAMLLQAATEARQSLTSIGASTTTTAAAANGEDLADLPDLHITLPEPGFALWVDPGCVSWRPRGFGPVEVLWLPTSSMPDRAANNSMPGLYSHQPPLQQQVQPQQQTPNNSAPPSRPGTPDLKRHLQDTFKAKIQQQLLVSSAASIQNHPLSTGNIPIA